VRIVPNEQFLCDASAFAEWSETRNSRLRMEDFYRWQRHRLNVLIEPDGQPTGGRWNFDEENRQPPPKDGRLWPQPELFQPDDIDQTISVQIDELSPLAFGSRWDGLWPTTTQQAEQRLDRVIHEVLPRFGPHEDAMMHDEWHLAHTLLSSSLNLGLLHPSTVVDRAQAAYRSGTIPLASAEGFIRQVIGWREYVWGLYWLWMPDYANENALEATATIPPSFLGATTKMRCVSRTVADIEARSYAHHIQRLMVLGNLALLAGINPQAMTDWMSTSFIDAADWVMVPNVVGMSLHADGGRMATKPYASGGAYISKMSDYCKGCAYDPKKRTGDNACPYTTLYWDFLARHQNRFAGNHRMAQPLAGLRRLSDLDAVRKRASDVIDQLQSGSL
jgi:deoxyribodipyrimidine photolyase-related protein